MDAEQYVPHRKITEMELALFPLELIAVLDPYLNPSLLADIYDIVNSFGWHDISHSLRWLSREGLYAIINTSTKSMLVTRRHLPSTTMDEIVILSKERFLFLGKGISHMGLRKFIQRVDATYANTEYINPKTFQRKPLEAMIVRRQAKSSLLEVMRRLNKFTEREWAEQNSYSTSDLWLEDLENDN